MPFDLKEFRANMQYGYLKPSYFMFNLSNPPAFYGGSTRFLSFLCAAATLPGTQIITSDERVNGYGMSRRIPHDVAQTDVTLTFYADGNGESLAFFDQWMRNIVSFGQRNKPIAGAMPGEVQYPDHYETTIEILGYNDNPGYGGTELYALTLERAYPISVGEISLDWSQSDGFSSIPVTFTFRNSWLEKNNAAKYGSGGLDSITRTYNYFDNMRSNGFLSQNAAAESRRDGAESINAGFIGIPGLSSALGAVASLQNAIGDKLAVVNNVAAGINSQIASVGSFMNPRSQTKLPSIPTVSPILFPR